MTKISNHLVPLTTETFSQCTTGGRKPKETALSGLPGEGQQCGWEVQLGPLAGYQGATWSLAVLLASGSLSQMVSGLSSVFLIASYRDLGEADVLLPTGTCLSKVICYLLDTKSNVVFLGVWEGSFYMIFNQCLTRPPLSFIFLHTKLNFIG